MNLEKYDENNINEYSNYFLKFYNSLFDIINNLKQKNLILIKENQELLAKIKLANEQYLQLYSEYNNKSLEK